ncbi:hypothetical protein OAU13_00060 [bacterium]|nr:hypothetical protein [bacterium]
MSHFAKIENGIVTDVIVAEQDFIQTLQGTWIQTSYNTKGGVHYNAETNAPSDDQSKALRKNYAGVGYTYDSVRDAFIPPKPFESWVLDEHTCLWMAPVQQPVEDGKFFYWDEELQNWLEIPNE